MRLDPLLWFSLFTLLALVTLSSASPQIRCDADLTTKFAINKRSLEKKLACRLDLENIVQCDDLDAVDRAWQRFEDVNDEYSQAISECKLSQHKPTKQRRFVAKHQQDHDDDCGCGFPPNPSAKSKFDRTKDEMSNRRRLRRRSGCGCSMVHHKQHMPRHHSPEKDDMEGKDPGKMRMRHHQMHRHLHHRAHHHMQESVENDENEDPKTGGDSIKVQKPDGQGRKGRGDKGRSRNATQSHDSDENTANSESHDLITDDDIAMIDGRYKRDKSKNLANVNKQERGKHGRTYVPHRHRSKPKNGRRRRINKKVGGKQSAQMVRRHDHGSNDDARDEEAVPEANDRSKTHLLRMRRAARSCIVEGTEEVDRLMAKYTGVCDRHQICEKDGMDEDAKQSMKDLSKKRQKLYREYLSAFDQCYGSITH